jgi:hypothetical protein
VDRPAVEKSVRRDHWTVTRRGNDSIARVYGKHCLLSSYITYALLFWDMSLTPAQKLNLHSLTILKGSQALILRRLSPSNSRYSAQVCLYSPKSALGRSLTFPVVLQVSYLITSHISRYMECPRTCRPYTVSQSLIAAYWLTRTFIRCLYNSRRYARLCRTCSEDD